MSRQALLDEVVRQLPTAVIVVEAPTGRVLAANEQVRIIWRRPPIYSPDVQGYSAWEGFHPDGSPYLPEEWPIARSLRGEHVPREEIRIRRGDGSYGFIRVSSNPIRNGANDVVAAVAAFVDITDERREQDALTFLAEASAMTGETLEYEQTLQAVARLAIPRFADLGFVYLVDRDGELQRNIAAASSPELERKLDTLWARYPPATEAIRPLVESGESRLDRAVEASSWDYVPDPEQRRLLIDLGIRSSVTVPMRAFGRTYGVLIYALTREFRPYDEFDLLIAGEIGRRAASAVEKSQLFEAERDTRIRAERSARRLMHLQTLTAALSGAITVDGVLDAVMREIGRVVNAANVVLTVREDDELVLVRHEGIPDHIARQFHRIALDAPWPLARAARTALPVWLRNEEEAIALIPEMATIPRSGRAWAAIPLVLNGRSLGVIGFVFSEEHDFSEEERGFVLSVAGQCAIALERAMLFESERTSREEAERASRAKDEFLAILSHELRTPMTTVIGWADFLTMTNAENPELLGPLEALRNSAKAQARLVDDLLDVSRIIAGKLSITRIRTELTSIVRSAIETLRMSAEQKGVALVLELSEQPVPILGDPDRLRQIVTNLVVNGIKFTPAGGRVTVSVHDREGVAELVVSDTGEGISPEFLPHVFDRFLQGSVGDSRRHAGLGLGLSIVQHLVQRHEGTVRAESAGLGDGATFVVTLPKRA
ncbi:MAG TPA: ATP-binding protein [Thermoanaerobaculia bacterium]